MNCEVFNDLHNRYDDWFDTSPGKEIFELEIQCLKAVSRKISGPWLEIGVGTGRFAEKLRVDFGVDPSEKMLRKAFRRGVKVIKATGEHLPFLTGSFNGVAMIVTFCFLDDPSKALKECFYILRKGGTLILGTVPKNSKWGRFYLKKKSEGHPFYSVAHFYTIQETINLSEKVGFELETIFSTLFEGPEECAQIRPYPPKPGWMKKAGFACIKMRKP